MKIIKLLLLITLFIYSTPALSRSNSDDTSSVIVIILIVVGIIWFINSIVKSYEKKLITSYIKKEEELISNYEKKTASLQEIYDKKTQAISLFNQAQEKGYINGRKWLAELISEADDILEKKIIEHLLYKKHPAERTAELLKNVRLEKREWKYKAKLLQYQLATLKEYFPFIEEFEEAIYDETIDFSKQTDQLTDIDQAIKYLSKEEFDKLPDNEKNQLALDRYINKNHSKTEIGKMYERYIGFLYEKEGFDVSYNGIIKGFEDMGRDLVAKKNDVFYIIQVKCWSANKTIHEKHIFQLFGTSLLFSLNNQVETNTLFNTPAEFKSAFYTTTTFSDVALSAAKKLNISLYQKPLQKDYPMIKCNINNDNKIFHLPFDQQYDRVKIDYNAGEFYAKTIKEATDKGFRRAFKFNYNAQIK